MDAADTRARPPVTCCFGARAAAFLATLLAAAPIFAQTQPVHEPDLAWRTLTTAHFWVHVPAGFEELGRTVARLAEEAYEPVSRSLNYYPPRTHVVVHTRRDLGGFVSIMPMRMEISPDVPQTNFAGSRDEWLRMLITHELTHVVQIRKHAGLSSLTRALTGDLNAHWAVFAPRWFTEGFAVLNETRFTGGGRARNAYHLMRMPGRPGGGEAWPLENTNFFSRTRYPDDIMYVSGSHLSQHVSDRFGEEVWAGVLDRYASFPLFGFDRAVRARTGAGSNELYREMLGGLGSGPREPAPTPRLWRQTDLVENQLSPRWRGPDHLVIYRSGYDDLPEIAEIDREGRARRLMQRRLTWSDHNFAVHDDVLVWSEYRQHPSFWATLSPELRLARLDTGTARAVTGGARVASLDLSPDGTAVVGVQQTPPTTRLVTVRLHDGQIEPLLSIEGGTIMNPRWSRDGRSVAFALNDETGRQDIAVYQLATKEWRYLYTPDVHHDADPGWSPDGRHVLYTSDRSGTLNVWAVSVATGDRWQVTDVELGAQMPDVSPGGTELAFSTYTSAGFRAATMPLDPARWVPEAAVEPRPLALGYRGPAFEPPTPASAIAVPAVTSAYRPWGQILRPQAWLPWFSKDEKGASAGFTAWSRDTLHRHAWSGTLLLSAHDLRPSFDASYTYSRWRPVVDVRAFSLPDREGDGWTRDRGVELTAALPLVLERNVDTTFLRPFAGLRLEAREPSTGADRVSSRDYRGLRAGVGFSRSAQTVRDVAPRRGVNLHALGDWSRRGFLGSEYDARQLSALASVYVPTPVRHHQLQFMGRYQARDGDFEHQFFGAVPFDQDDDGQPRQLVLTAANHFPIAYPEWATPLAPIYVESLAGSFFVDWGTSWGPDARAGDRGRYSVGTRLTAAGRLLRALPARFTLALFYDSTRGGVRAAPAFQVLSVF